MKLQYQLNAAFTTLLIVIMSVTAYTIYSLLLNLLIQDEQRQLRAKGELLVSILNDEYNSVNVQRFLNEQDLQLFIYDSNSDQILLSTLPSNVTKHWVENYDLSSDEQPLWRAGDERYVVSKIAFYTEIPGAELVLVTPLDDLQAVQHTFIFRLLVVFLIGVSAAIALSYLLTRRLVTPLTRLKHQIKKIQNRQFDDLKEIDASGEIKEVEQSVMEMARELERYISSQKQFFQNASHELKTPLMTIQGYAEGIRDGVFTESDAERGLDVVVQEISRLKKIINEMILLAKLDSEENIYEKELIKVEELITLIVERALPLANERSISLDYDTKLDTLLEADKEKLLQASMNIVSNAVRHAESKVEVRSYEKNERVYLTVADDGPGVNEDLIPHLFHRFVKGKGGETGLGLAIARAIIERSGGAIAVETSHLGGALFIVSFPKKENEK
ncbi:HAMP domain-containing histidine kinase [Radiobacillus kanasensis]|uniref:sensor histidine kinase n=1 Tax=Radiobacillus kanasensis TaxID=2844358 RepID=UPI001E2B1643|nr:HAMP domain-containing sensor histidine kinase [Radiobacillus kanasensis]UFT99782.1 HAMP domain-containing histidine kinase [Radiobacillus kanasensis]